MTAVMPEVGSIVQVKPEVERWGACLVIVTELKSWGIQGYTTMPMQGDAFIRLKFEDFEIVGRALYMRGDTAEDSV